MNKVKYYQRKIHKLLSLDGEIHVFWYSGSPSWKWFCKVSCHNDGWNNDWNLFGLKLFSLKKCWLLAGNIKNLALIKDFRLEYVSSLFFLIENLFRWFLLPFLVVKSSPPYFPFLIFFYVKHPAFKN